MSKGWHFSGFHGLYVTFELQVCVHKHTVNDDGCIH